MRREFRLKQMLPFIASPNSLWLSEGYIGLYPKFFLSIEAGQNKKPNSDKTSMYLLHTKKKASITALEIGDEYKWSHNTAMIYKHIVDFSWMKLKITLYNSPFGNDNKTCYPSLQISDATVKKSCFSALWKRNIDRKTALTREDCNNTGSVQSLYKSCAFVMSKVCSPRSLLISFRSVPKMSTSENRVEVRHCAIDVLVLLEQKNDDMIIYS